MLFTLACSSSEYWVEFLLCESFVLNSEFFSYLYFISILDNLSLSTVKLPPLRFSSKNWQNSSYHLSYHEEKTTIFPYFLMNFIQFQFAESFSYFSPHKVWAANIFLICIFYILHFMGWKIGSDDSNIIAIKYNNKWNGTWNRKIGQGCVNIRDTCEFSWFY